MTNKLTLPPVFILYCNNHNWNTEFGYMIYDYASWLSYYTRFMNSKGGSQFPQISSSGFFFHSRKLSSGCALVRSTWSLNFYKYLEVVVFSFQSLWLFVMRVFVLCFWKPVKMKEIVGKQPRPLRNIHR